MQRPRRNPFYVVLGLVGFLFTITASSYCLFVLRGVRPETAQAAGPHPFAGQLVILAIATVGAVAVDHYEGERIRRERNGGGRGSDAP
jgi:hypothetical protein